MSTPYDRPLRFKLQAQRSYQVWLLMLHGMAMVLLVFFTDLSDLLTTLLSSALLCSLYWQWQKLRLLPCRLLQKTDLDWLLEDQSGKQYNAVLMPEAYVSAWLIVLSFTLENGKRLAVVILPYMLAGDDFRRLAAYLRMTNLSGLMDE